MTTDVKKVRPEPVPWWAWGILAVIILLFAAWHLDFGTKEVKSSASAYPICAETLGGVKVTFAKPEADVKLNPKCRSGWVELPNGGPRYRARITSPGDLEIVFWDGRPPMLVGATESIWAGYIQNQTFRLRGEGVAKITIEPLSTAPVAVPTPPAASPPPARPHTPSGVTA